MLFVFLTDVFLIRCMLFFFSIRCILLIHLRDSMLAEISCFHDYGQELALSLLYLQIGRQNRQN